MPVPETLALLLVAIQVPRGTASVKEISRLAHTAEEPVMVPAEGSGFIVKITVAATLPQLLISV